jgi:transcriptional repressor NrdR
MNCPDCHHEETAVLETRLVREGTVIRRRRQCLSCNSRFSTLEQLDQKELMVEKRDGRREPFAEEKVRGGIKKALTKRPVEEEQVEGLVERVRQEIAKRGERVVKAADIGQLIMAGLKEVGGGGFFRVGLVCDQYDDISSFEKDIKELKSN